MRTKYRTGNNIHATNGTRMILVKQPVPHKQAAKEAMHLDPRRCVGPVHVSARAAVELGSSDSDRALVFEAAQKLHLLYSSANLLQIPLCRSG